MARRKAEDPPYRLAVSLPVSLVQRLQLLFMDPLNKRARYGSLSKLIERLLRDWLDKTDK